MHIVQPTKHSKAEDAARLHEAVLRGEVHAAVEEVLVHLSHYSQLLADVPVSLA